MIHAAAAQFLPPHGDGDETGRPGGFDPAAPAPHEDLPYRVEIWDEAGEFPEQLVAVTANASVGYAAYYAAAREYPGRVITLRCNGQVLSRWTQRAH